LSDALVRIADHSAARLDELLPHSSCPRTPAWHACSFGARELDFAY
jgi:hypothetical protein